MTSNYEKVYKKVMPAVRAAAARRMVSAHQITQQQAASLLGITQAGISKALSRRSDYNVKISNHSLHMLTQALIAHDDREAQKQVCAICQHNIKFNCALMVK